MLKMRISPQWVRWIMICVESIDYYAIVNNKMIDHIILGRGLHQEDPLSRYLFILCVEILSSIIWQAEGRGDVHCINTCWNAHVVSQLIFADDCLLFPG